jgi:hypothetical protein
VVEDLVDVRRARCARARDVQAPDAGDRYTVRSYMATKVRVLARLGF